MVPVLCVVVVAICGGLDRAAKPCIRSGHRTKGPGHERIPVEPNPPMGRGVCGEVWSGLAEFFKNAAVLVCVVAFVTSIAFTLMTAAHYRDASSYIYAKAYVQASELRDSVLEEATPKEAAGQEVAKASWEILHRQLQESAQPSR